MVIYRSVYNATGRVAVTVKQRSACARPRAGMPPREKGRRWAWIVLIWVGLAIAGVFLLRSDYGLPANAAAALPPPAATTPLSVDEWNHKLRLNWNPSDQTLRSAAHAEVEIIDGDQRARIALPPAVI